MAEGGGGEEDRNGLEEEDEEFWLDAVMLCVVGIWGTAVMVDPLDPVLEIDPFPTGPPPPTSNEPDPSSGGEEATISPIAGGGDLLLP